MRNRITQNWWAGLVVIVASLGCSASGPPPSGIVRFEDGQPVESGSIEFRELETGERFSGRISGGGSFELQDQSGDLSFPPGEYEVVVVQIVLTEDLASESHQHGRTVPRRYADYYTSGLRITNRSDRTAPLMVVLNSTP